MSQFKQPAINQLISDMKYRHELGWGSATTMFYELTKDPKEIPVHLISKEEPMDLAS
jgi:hypothetical protein